VCGPFDDIVKPAHVTLLDYELEIGLVIGRELPVGTEVTEANLADYVSALVVTNDVSARDVQITKAQFFESKVLSNLHPGRARAGTGRRRRAQALRRSAATAAVNGQVRQDMIVEGDILYPPLLQCRR